MSTPQLVFSHVDNGDESHELEIIEGSQARNWFITEF